MAEVVIGDGDNTKAKGSVIGQRPVPPGGLNPVSKDLHDLADEVRVLEAERDELFRIRATLLLNFGATDHNRYDFTVVDQGGTHDLLMRVLEQCCTRLLGLGKGK